MSVSPQNIGKKEYFAVVGSRDGSNIGNPHFLLRACPSCDALWSIKPLADGELAKCERCSAVIDKRDDNSLEVSLAVSLSALILTLIALSFPFLSVSTSGLSNQISVLDAISALWTASMPIVSIACFVLIFGIPIIRIVLLSVIVAENRRIIFRQRLSASIYRFTSFLRPWSMMEIFLIGVIVSLVKVGSLASVEVGFSFWALCALVAALTYIESKHCQHTTWAVLSR